MGRLLSAHPRIEWHSALWYCLRAAHDPTESIGELGARLGRSAEEILDAIDAYNSESEHGLKIMRWDDEVGLIPDPELQLPDGPAVQQEPDAALVDQLLWQVIDRTLAERLPAEAALRLDRMTREGLVMRFDGEWRPTDTVIDALDLIGWDTMALVTYARGGPEQPPAA